MNRLMVALKRGLTPEDFDGEYWEIRLEAYRKLGFTEKAFTDDSVIIREEAKFMLPKKAEVTPMVGSDTFVYTEGGTLKKVKDLKSGDKILIINNDISEVSTGTITNLNPITHGPDLKETDRHDDQGELL